MQPLVGDPGRARPAPSPDPLPRARRRDAPSHDRPPGRGRPDARQPALAAKSACRSRSSAGTCASCVSRDRRHRAPGPDRRSAGCAPLHSRSCTMPRRRLIGGTAGVAPDRRRAGDGGRCPLAARTRRELRRSASVLPPLVKTAARGLLTPVVRLAIALHLTPNTITVIGLAHHHRRRRPRGDRLPPRRAAVLDRGLGPRRGRWRARPGHGRRARRSAGSSTRPSTARARRSSTSASARGWS